MNFINVHVGDKVVAIRDMIGDVKKGMKFVVTKIYSNPSGVQVTDGKVTVSVDLDTFNERFVKMVDNTKNAKDEYKKVACDINNNKCVNKESTDADAHEDARENNDDVCQCDGCGYCDNNYDYIDELVDELLEESSVDIEKFYDNCMVITYKLPNGYVVTDYAFRPTNMELDEFGEEEAVEEAEEKIRDKVRELELYHQMSVSALLDHIDEAERTQEAWRKYNEPTTVKYERHTYLY